MLYSFVSLVCLAILFLIFVGYALAILLKPHRERIEFIRKFKKGNCSIVYLVAIPLYWMGYIYSGQNAFLAFFNAVSKTMTLVVLRYDASPVSALMEANGIYKFTLYACFVVVTLNAMMFVFSLLHQKIWEWYRRRLWDFTRKERLLIVGNNSENIKIYSSATKHSPMILDDIGGAEKAKLFAKKISFISKSTAKESCCKFLKHYYKGKKSCIVVINTGDDDKNIAICHSIIRHTREYFEGKNDSQISDILSRIRIYVFGMPMHESIYDGIVEMSNGSIRYVNKYRQIAMNFVDKYPLTQFMTDEQIDYKTSLIKDGIDINVAMIGFGKTNQQIFLTSVANNQFLVEEGGEKLLKQVHYHIFDRQHLENNKNLNHTYYRFKNEFEDKIKLQENLGDKEYLPFPRFPAEEHYDKLDINDASFYKKIKSALCGENKFNYIIVGFGTDLENIDMAQKMIEKKQEWGLNNTYIFVKVRSGNDTYSIFRRNDCFMIGDEKRAVYNINEIDDNTVTAMAKKRNRIYSLEYKIKTGELKDLTSEAVSEAYATADCDWYIKKTQFERESNLYACLSIRSKLHLMGLDYAPDKEVKAEDTLNEAEYISYYAKNDKIDYYPGRFADGKKIVEYKLDSNPDSLRTTMAIQEHLRWNSFMISKGFVPSCKEEILAGNNGKNYSLRRHGNITTFEGLVEFRKMVAEKQNTDELAADVIKYDYQLLDDAGWLLTNHGYSIFRRA